MYRYDEFDAAFVRQRVAQFRDQVERRVSGELTEDEFRPLRLMNGVYLQLHAYMLRIAVPYGTLSSRQMRKLAHIARTYDRGTRHSVISLKAHSHRTLRRSARSSRKSFDGPVWITRPRSSATVLSDKARARSR